MKNHDLCTTIIPFNLKIKVFSDITGALPHKPSRRNFYVVVVYDYDSNSILAEPIKNRQAATIRDALLKIHKVLKARDSYKKFNIMDNKCSSDVRESM